MTLQHRQLAAWSLGISTVFALILLKGFHSGETDSNLYAEMVVRLSHLPLRSWIAPEWWGFWGRDELFREHPVGIFLLPALIARAGVPALQAAYLVNVLYQVAAIVLMQRLAARFVPSLEANAIGWIVLLLPISFMYRLRANHEPAMLVCLLLALYATHRSIDHRGWAAVTSLALTGALLVKGALGIFVLLGCAVVLWVCRQRVNRGTVAALALACVLPLATGLGYEAAYRAVTGEPFWPFYARQWFDVAAEPRGIWPPLRKVVNAGWYLSRYLWYAFPVSLAFVYAIWRRRGALARVLSGRSIESDSDRGRALQGLAIAVGTWLLYLCALSLSDRTMTRYAFPAIQLVGATGAVIAVAKVGWVRRLARQIDPIFPEFQVAVWLGTVGLFLMYDG